MTTLTVKCYGRNSAGVVGTLKAKVGWTGPWIIEGDAREIEAQEAQVMNLFQDFDPIGTPEITA